MTSEQIVAAIAAKASQKAEADFPHDALARQAFLIGVLKDELIDALGVMSSSSSPRTRRHLSHLRLRAGEATKFDPRAAGTARGSEHDRSATSNR